MNNQGILGGGNGGLTGSAFSRLRSLQEENTKKITDYALSDRNRGGFLGGIGYSLEKIGLGFLSGLEGIWDYTAGGLAKLFGADEWAEEQFANDWVNYNHADEWFNPDSGWKFVGDITNGIGTSLPSMAALIGVGAATGGAAVPAMITTFLTAGLSAAGNATKEAYRQTGELGGKEFGYGALVGLTEGAVETFSDAVLGGVGGQITKAFRSDIAASAVRQTFGKTLAKSFLSEGFEEVISEFADPYWKRLTYDPTAQNASIEELAYAGLVGGLSGALMSGFGGAVSNVRNIRAGSQAVANGRVADIISDAQNISVYEAINKTEYDSFSAVRDTLSELHESLKSTNGNVETVKQRLLLGRLQRANTAAVFQPIISRSAENIYANAEQVAQRMTEFGYTDANGKPIVVTAEQLRAGVDTSSKRAFRKSMAQALQNNSALRTLAVLDATGQLILDAQKFKDVSLRGRALASQVDLNRFIEATESEEGLKQRAAVAEALGIEDWNTLTAEELQSKIEAFEQNGGSAQYRAERADVQNMQSISPEEAQSLPASVVLVDGAAVRYSLGNNQIAIERRGDGYRLYDYASGRLTKNLTQAELDTLVSEMHAETAQRAATQPNVEQTAGNPTNTAETAQTAQEGSQERVGQQSAARETMSREAQEIDTYARENIEGYNKLGAANQSMIRSIIRQGRAAGVEESFVLSCARVSAHSGLNIVFSKELCFVKEDGSFADGSIDLKNNRIIINPEAKGRSGEEILIHELTHAIYNMSDGTLQVAEGLETMSAEEKERIRKRYSEVGHGSAVEVSDEINAHFAEETLANKNILERLVKKKPTLKQKILGFFKGARADYASDAGLSGAAKRLYSQYSKLFEEFSQRNALTNASEGGIYIQEQTKKRRNALDMSKKQDKTSAATSINSSKLPAVFSRVQFKRGTVNLDIGGGKFDNATEFLATQGVKNYIYDPYNRSEAHNRAAARATENGQSDTVTISNVLNVIDTLEGRQQVLANAVDALKPDGTAYITVYEGNGSGEARTTGADQFQLNRKLRDYLPEVRQFFDDVTVKNGVIIARSPIKTTSEQNGGKRFALAGERSATADSSMLARAKEMQAEGYDSEEIRQETGWFVSFDGKWRYEIDDSAMKPIESAKFDRHMSEFGDYRTAKLGDVIQHDKLFEAYPQLKDVTLIVQETGVKNNGTAFTKDNQIVLNEDLFRRPTEEYKRFEESKKAEIEQIEQTQDFKDYDRFYADDGVREEMSAEEWIKQEKAARDKFFSSELGKRYHELMWGKSPVQRTEFGWTDRAKTTLIHEIQHFVQSYEGFSGGTSETYWANRLYKQYRSSYESARDSFLEVLPKLPTEARNAVKDLQDRMFDDRYNFNNIYKDSEEIADLIGNEKYEQLWREYIWAYGGLYNFQHGAGNEAYNRYWNTAGEVEARDVASRIDLSAEERKAKRPTVDGQQVYFTEDGSESASRYALPDTDSKGHKLTAAQKAYFDGTKVVDKDGNLLVVYHQTNSREYVNTETGQKWSELDWKERAAWEEKSDAEWSRVWKQQDFYVFDNERARRSIEMPAFFFSPEYDQHHEYGERTIEAYLLMKNPAYNPEIENRGETDTAGADAMQKLIEQGYDGFVRTDDDGNIYEYAVFNSNQIKQTSNKRPTTNSDIRYALPRSDGRRLDNYSVLQYNNFGWVRANDVISPRQWADFNSKFTQAKNGREQFVKTKSGDFIIPVNDMAGDSFGVDNVLVYARGSLENPKISKIVKINLANETDIDIIRSDIYAYEKRGNTQTSSYVASLYGEEFIREYTQQTVRNYQEYKAAIGARSGGAESRGVDGAHQQQQNGSRNTQSGKRYALSSTDSEGKVLSEQQRRYFKDSKVVDKDGRLQVVYHATNAIFTQVDFKKGSQGLFWFTSSKANFENGNTTAAGVRDGSRVRVMELYADIEKPAGWDEYDKYGIDQLQHMGYDGAILDKGDGTFDGFVFKSANQVKSVDNKSPTKAKDIRFALSEDGERRRTFSRGQRAKFSANNTRFKVYSRVEAQDVINSIIDERLDFGDRYGYLSGKSKEQVIDMLFQKLNSTPEGYQIGVALDIADYIIENAYLEDMYAAEAREEAVSEAMGTLSILRSYMHRMDLRGIKGEIQYRYDKKNAINLVWGAKEGGIAPDQVAQELESYGIYLKAINEADQFFEMLDMYESERATVNERAEKVKLSTYGGAEQIESLRQDIARDILRAYDTKGSKSKFAKLVEQYDQRIESLKQEVREAGRRNKLTNSIIDTAQYLRDIATKRKYVGADVFSAPELTAWLKNLGRMKYRSDLRKAGARQILLDYGKFYNTSNPLLYDADPNLSYIDENVLDALAFIKQNEGSAKPLSTEELQAAQIIMLSAKHLFDNYDQIIMEGKKVSVTELATQGNEILQRSKNHTGRSVFNTLYGVTNKIIEPRAVIRSLENYDPNGVLTRAYKAITDGETAAGLRYIELMTNFDNFLAEHKKYKKRLSSTRITVAGADLTVGQAISLYELSKRGQARDGLFEAGFSYMDQRGAKKSARITESDIAALEKQFTAEDKEFIAIVEDFFNVQSKQLKTKADMQILGYTNASDEFYFPIKRDQGTIARNITDARSIMADWANVYNFSFNKDVKTGAKNKLFITGVYDVVTRHAKQLSTYAELTVPLKNFSQIYSKNIGTKTNAVSMRNTLNEQIWGRTDDYLSKLFKDIQGTATSNSIIEKLRGAYAKYQLGANLKVIVSQVTSYPTAGIYLDVASMTRGAVMRTNWEAMDKYCPYARVRNYERGIVRAEGVVDKVGKVGDVLTKPIQWTDRATIGKLWNACQVQIERNGGAKVGTQENMEKAGVLLEDVIRLTQPNYTNTERSELMRSDSDLWRSFTMFTSVPLKQLSRFVESFGEYRALRETIKAGNADAETQARYKQASKRLRRTFASITIANLMYCLVGQFFKWLYDKDRKDKDGNEIGFMQDFFNDFVSTSIGMFPVVKDIYNYFANDYEFNNFAYETVNSVLSASQELFDLATKAAGGEVTETSDYMRAFRNSLYAIGQLTGLPFRNINNTISGLIKRFDPAAAYKYNSLFYNAQYSSDIKAALEKGDTKLADTIMALLLNERGASGLSDAARAKMIELYEKGYDVLPRTVGDKITFNGEERTISAKERNTITAAHEAASSEISQMVTGQAFMRLSESAQAKAIKKTYDSHYEEALAGLYGVPIDDKFTIVSKAIGITKAAPVIAGASELTSEKIGGQIVQGSRKNKVVSYLQSQSMLDAERLLLLYYLGYKIGDGEYKGMTAKAIQRLLAQYITQRKLSREEKTALAEMCGLTVKNGRIYITAA